MSHKNVEILRQANGAFNRGDIDGFLAFCSEDLEVEDLNNAPDLPPVAYGKEGSRRVFTAWTEAFDDFVGQVEEYIDIDDRHVGCVVRYRGKQRDTGLEVDFRGVDLWELDGNKVVRGVLGFPNRESALQAVRLSAQDSQP